MIIHQPINGNLGTELINAINTNSYMRLNIISAYAKMSGIHRIEDSLINLKNIGGEINMFIGVDQKNTSYEALCKIFDISNNLFIIHNENLKHTFHHKVYLLDKNIHNNNSVWLAVGSNNLTAGGLFINYESFFLSELDISSSYSNEMYSRTVSLLANYGDLSNSMSMYISDKSMIDKLYNNGYISKESESSLSLIKESTTSAYNSKTKLFGNESYSAPSLPKKAIKKISLPKPDSIDKSAIGINAENDIDSEIFWFQMGKSTGGSRNILDLSSNGLFISGTIPQEYNIDGSNKIWGGVKFFGIDPNNHTQEKNITISYNGNDYYPTTIKFAHGNSNWRIQLKGNSSTDNLALSRYGVSDFQYNILIFRKTTPFNYSLKVLPPKKLEELISYSCFYAYNGRSKTGRFFGKLN